MSYFQPFLRLVAIGSLYSTDTFTFSMALIQGAGGNDTAPDEVPAGIISAFQAFWQDTDQPISEGARLQTLKLNEIGTDGRYVAQETVFHDYDPPIQGTSGTHHPPQVALAITLETALTRGRAHAGRFYLPIPGQPANASGYLDSSEQVRYGSNVRVLLDAINDAMPSWEVGVVSNLGTGAQQRVTGIKVGRVFDTIRSRRSAFTEDYYSVALTPNTP